MTSEGSENNDIALAGEYALHLMDAEQRLAFEQRLVAEPRLRELLRDWDEHLVPLTDEIADVAPPPNVWGSLENSLFGAPAPKARSLWSWRYITAGLGAAIAVAVVVNVSGMLGTTSTIPEYTAEIIAEDQGMILLASVDLDNGEMIITRDTGTVLSGRSQELWLIPDGATVPISLGVLNSDPKTNVKLSAQQATLLNGATLAISDEPLGGSPTGAPTGAILAAGTLSSV